MIKDEKIGYDDFSINDRVRIEMEYFFVFALAATIAAGVRFIAKALMTDVLRNHIQQDSRQFIRHFELDVK
jgi:hypothetical protein